MVVPSMHDTGAVNCMYIQRMCITWNRDYVCTVRYMYVHYMYIDYMYICVLKCTRWKCSCPYLLSIHTSTNHCLTCV